MEYAIVLLPLLGSIISGFCGKRLGAKSCQILTSSFVSISAILSFFIFYDVLTEGYSSNKLIFNWISSGSFHVNWSINIDPLTSVMLVVVSLISSIIHFYSIGYMDDDPHKARFMAYLSLFTFAMLTLVTADNFLQLYFGWEGVGLCSYLLIGFWYKKPSANAAAIKAFIVNRVGDFGFAIGIFLIFFFYGTVNYDEVFQQTPLLIQKQVIFLGIEFNLITLICLLLFLGAMGKSAQILLHTWLPDAMEGPTPVSALIHAATMVTAGVFLVVRCSPIFEYSQVALNVVTAVGMTTAFFAATVALVQNDIKKIVAYSTCSQLGYMFFAAGLGAYWIALFHLAAHAFFKALLFLGAGNVMHAMDGELDIFKMGGLKKAMAWTYGYIGLASLALAGIPPLAGYFSKDAIIETAFNEGTLILWGMLVFTAGLTAFYSFRQVFLTFEGEERYKPLGFHPHEMYKYVLIAMSPLAILAISAGWYMDEYKEFIYGLIPAYEMSEHTHHIAWLLGTLVVIVALSVITLAYIKYARKGVNAFKRDEEKEKSFIYKLLKNQYYVPVAYEMFITKPYAMISEHLWKDVDMKIVDASVDGIANFLYRSGDSARKMQTGNLSNYLNWMAVGSVLLLVIAAISAMFV